MAAINGCESTRFISFRRINIVCARAVGRYFSGSAYVSLNERGVYSVSVVAALREIGNESGECERLDVCCCCLKQVSLNMHLSPLRGGH